MYGRTVWKKKFKDDMNCDFYTARIVQGSVGVVLLEKCRHVTSVLPSDVSSVYLCPYQIEYN